MSFPLKSVLLLDGWSGRTEQAVEIVAETEKCYRIRAVSEPVRLAGRHRVLAVGETALVPKYAVRMGPDKCEICHGKRGGVPGNENWVGGKTVCDSCHSDMLREPAR